MSYGAALFLGLAIYLLFLLGNVACVALCYFRGRRARWLHPLVLGISAIPVAFFGIGFCAVLKDPSGNDNPTVALILCAAMALPFLACFIASAILWYRQRKPATLPASS